jgi:magnesium-transporting ATPase (P-type)
VFVCVQVTNLKGAPQVILNMSHNADELRDRVRTAVQELADRGFRSLGVGISYTGEHETPHWEFQPEVGGSGLSLGSGC